MLLYTLCCWECAGRYRRLLTNWRPAKWWEIDSLINDQWSCQLKRSLGLWFTSSNSSKARFRSRCSSVSMGWHRTTCLLCATLYPESLDARTFALRIADSSTSHALHCHRAVFEPSRMLVHLCGTLCPFISRTAIWLLQLLCAIFFRIRLLNLVARMLD